MSITKLDLSRLETQWRSEEHKTADRFRRQGAVDGCQCSAQRVTYEERLYPSVFARHLRDAIRDRKRALINPIVVGETRCRHPFEEMDVQALPEAVADRAR